MAPFVSTRSARDPVSERALARNCKSAWIGSRRFSSHTPISSKHHDFEPSGPICQWPASATATRACPAIMGRPETKHTCIQPDPLKPSPHRRLTAPSTFRNMQLHSSIPSATGFGVPPTPPVPDAFRPQLHMSNHSASVQLPPIQSTSQGQEYYGPGQPSIHSSNGDMNQAAGEVPEDPTRTCRSTICFTFG